MNKSKSGVWWNEEKVDELILLIVNKRKEKLFYKDFNHYIKGIIDTLTTMYGKEFVGIFLTIVHEQELISSFEYAEMIV